MSQPTGETRAGRVVRGVPRRRIACAACAPNLRSTRSAAARRRAKEAQSGSHHRRASTSKASTQEDLDDLLESTRAFSIATSIEPHGRFYRLTHGFPYPKGSKHVAQARHFYLVDAAARFLRMCWLHVLSPFGFDAFGLPAEHEAAPTGWTRGRGPSDNIELFERVPDLARGLRAGSRVVMCEPEYYR